MMEGGENRDEEREEEEEQLYHFGSQVREFIVMCFILIK